jgi:hypothetical protein
MRIIGFPLPTTSAVNSDCADDIFAANKKARINPIVGTLKIRFIVFVF